MANTQSAKKRIRQNEKRRIRNKALRSHVKSAVKRARQALQKDDRAAAKEATLEAATALDRAASRGAIHAKNASRRKGRLMKRLAKLEN